MRRAFRLNGHDVQELSVELALPDPQLWYPWAHGEPALYRADVEITADERKSSSLSETFGIREVRLQTRAEGWTYVINGRPIFMRGANYCSEFFLDAAGDELLKSDVQLARQANMDMLRLNAHLEPPALYDAADRAGIVLWQDMPMTGSYLHRSDARSLAFFREAVTAQAEEMAQLLFNRPSVINYAVHADPPWSRSQAWLGERHTEQLNLDVDEEAAALLRSLDPSRPALAGAGDQDLHCGHGWSHGHWRELADLSPAFVSEVGAQALPNANSPVWRHLNRGWPVADDDENWRYAGYQPAEWRRSGIGPPSAHPSRDAYVRASQEYQAHLLRFAIDRFRRQKFAHCGGVLLFQLVDSFPAITAAIIDQARRPKRGYRVVADAFAPVIDEGIRQGKTDQVGNPGNREHQRVGRLHHRELLEQLVHVLERLLHLLFDQLELVPLQTLLKNLLGLHQVRLFFQVVKKAHGISPLSTLYRCTILPARVCGV